MKPSLHQSAASLITLTFVAVALAATAHAAEPLKALTWNVYIGASLDVITDTQDPNLIPFRVAQFVAAVGNTRFGERAELIADEIQRQAPDLVGLQEVAL